MLYKETEMQKWAGMLVETGKAFVDPSAIHPDGGVKCATSASSSVEKRINTSMALDFLFTRTS